MKCKIQNTGKTPVKIFWKNSLKLDSMLCPIFTDFFRVKVALTGNQHAVYLMYLVAVTSHTWNCNGYSIAMLSFSFIEFTLIHLHTQ